MENEAALRNLARVLIWSFLVSIALLFFWLVSDWIVGEWAYGVISWMFEITRREYDLVTLCGMAFLKLMAVVLFLAPYLAIRIVLRAK